MEKSPVEWMTALVLGAAMSMPTTAKTATTGHITGRTGEQYGIANKIGSSGRYTLYSCVLPNGQLGVLKVAADKGQNAPLGNEEVILKAMAAHAEEVESASPGVRLNYRYFFPSLVESFVSDSQGGRRITVLSYPDAIETVSQLTPVAGIAANKLRVDPRSMAWIFGKTLKMLGFAHDMGVTNGLVSASNILIETDLHGLIVFDWSLAKLDPSGFAPASITGKEIAAAAAIAVSALGGDPRSGAFPESDQLDERQQAEMTAFFKRLLDGRGASAAEEHHAFYEMIYRFWPRQFHPFTTFPIG